MSVKRIVARTRFGAAVDAHEELFRLAEEEIVAHRIGPGVAVHETWDLLDERPANPAGNVPGGLGRRRTMEDKGGDANRRKHIGDVPLHDRALERDRCAGTRALPHVAHVPVLEVLVVGDARGVLTKVPIEEIRRAPTVSHIPKPAPPLLIAARPRMLFTSATLRRRCEPFRVSDEKRLLPDGCEIREAATNDYEV
ncbi:hypothetical protein BH18ACT14_BH18ACT14_15730 [soil metagenome]